jgi:hypothetical protein
MLQGAHQRRTDTALAKKPQTQKLYRLKIQSLPGLILRMVKNDKAF